ncbi:17654_t:CDS:2 [Funneliformis geosporum]|uniref:15716_t:CDS:1 n=1 Tax=Funneliformis geosporum TaxID=1117311 RepID=A0A9W4SIJ0_9GLOM|nr:17654_t:CDS:2 [Funneliformis geosporum]CAI2169625.1 15716_t:CDS:2 [Funneliformis geosporum]
MGKAFSTFRARKSIRSKRASFAFESVQNVQKDAEPLKYFLPNFIEDTDIMVILHFLDRYLFQSNFNAPIEEQLIDGNFKILDACCGAGTWVLDMASIYKSSNFIGIDLCPVFPTEIKPYNVEFVQGDILEGLPFEDNTFDYVHQGNMVEIYTLGQWRFITMELIRVCKPGGYIEFTEPELGSNPGPILSKFYDALIELSESRNVKIRMYDNLISNLNSIPMVQNVESELKCIPLGSRRGGNAGHEYLEVHNGFFLNVPMPETMCKFMGLSVEQYLEMFKEARKEVADGISPECEVYRIWCQKIYEEDE